MTWYWVMRESTLTQANCEIEFYDMFRVLNFILVIGIEKTIPTCTVIRWIYLIMICILIYLSSHIRELWPVAEGTTNRNYQ